MPRQSRVLHLCAASFVGGPEKQILAQARYLPQHGFSATIGSFLQGNEGTAFLRAAADQGTETLPLPCGGALDFSPARLVASALVQQRIQLVCAHGAKAGLLGYLGARTARVPFLMWSRGWTGETLRMRLYDAVDRAMLRRAEMVIAVSHAQAGKCLRAGVQPARLRVVPNAVEGAAPPAAVALRAELGLSPASRLVISVGRLSPEKGHRHLIAAALPVLAAHPDAVFVLVGEGRERPRLEQRIRQLGLRGRVVIAGFRHDAAALMGQADLLVLPSLTEGLPNVVLEAFAAGLPVVATDVGGVAELVGPETGWLIAGPRALASAITEALALPTEARRRAAAARSLVLSEYSFTKQAESIAAAFREVLEASRERCPAGGDPVRTASADRSTR